MVRWSIGFLQGRKQGIRDPLPFSPFLCIYFFDENLFLTGTKSGLVWCFHSWLCIFLGWLCFLCSVFFWVNCSVFLGFLLPSGAVGCSISGFLLFFLPILLWFSAPFIETQLLASNQSCLYRTVIFPDKIVGERRGPRSDLLQIISSPAESGAPLLKRDGEDARLLATVPFRQKMGIFNLTPASGNLTIWSQQSFNFTLGLISIKSLNLFN